MKKESSKRRIPVIYLITALLILIILIAIIIAILWNSKEAYKIENRVEKIAEYQKKSEEYEVEGWLRVQGTNIDYPVIFTENLLDLNNIVEDFTWQLEKPEDLLNRTVILGHNIRNVSSNPIITDASHTRFEQLMSFVYYDFAKENQYIQYTKNGKDYLYKIFSVSFIDDVDLRYSGYLSQEELKEYIEKALEDSYFKYDVEIAENDKIITLITCTRFFDGSTNYKFKVEGKLVDTDEKTKLSTVTVKDNYKEIEAIMKGGEGNETKA